MAAFTHLHLYFFSGTGNSHRAAVWMAEAARARGVESAVTPIAAAQPPANPGPGELIGLVCPTHGFCAPWVMLRFAMRLPRARSAGAFAVATRGSVKIGKVFIPGLEGTAAYLLALILRLKGYRVVGAAGLDMPATWSAVMSALSPASVEAILARARPRVDRFMGRILDGQACFWSLIPLLLGLLLSFASLAYQVGRFFLTKMFYPSNACDGCGLCARSCPLRAVRMRGRPPRPYWTFLCESCTRCMNFCPKQAIEASYPFGLMVWFLFHIPPAVLLLDAVASRIGGPFTHPLVFFLWRMLALALAYGIFWLTLRIPGVNWLLTLLTPTHYFRRYRAPGAHLKDL